MEKTVTVPKKKGKIRQFIPLYLMALPGLLYLLINNYLPMAGLTIAFRNVNYAKGIWKSDWCGLANFKYLFATKDAWVITRNTIGYNLLFIVLQTVMAIAIALFLNEVKSKFWNRFFQTSVLLPYLFSYVIASYLVYAFLSPTTGMFNHILTVMGEDPVSWYMESKFWPFILTFVELWKRSGYTAIVYYATMVGIDSSLYEAAELDGAGKLKQIFSITIPLISPTIVLMSLLSVGRIFHSDFGLFYQIPMQSGIISSVTSTIDTYVYNGLMKLGDVGMSSAASFYQSIVGFILVMFSNWLVKKRNMEGSLF